MQSNQSTPVVGFGQTRDPPQCSSIPQPGSWRSLVTVLLGRFSKGPLLRCASTNIDFCSSMCSTALQHIQVTRPSITGSLEPPLVQANMIPNTKERKKRKMKTRVFGRAASSPVRICELESLASFNL